MHAYIHTGPGSEAVLELRPTLTSHVPTMVVAAIGDLDLCNASDLKAKLLRAMASGPRLLILDLERTTFLDSTILQVLVDVHRRAGLLGIAFCLTKAPRVVAKCLAITGLDTYLSVHPTVDAAVRAVQRSPAVRREPSSVVAVRDQTVRP